MLRIYLARHGQTDWNRERRLQGHTDVPLNDAGLAQAAALVKRLEGVALDHVYSSTLTRSRQTAAALPAGLPRTALPELNEQAMGKFEGAYLDGREPAVVLEFERRSVDPHDALDGGESLEQHFLRVHGAVERIRAAHPQGTILIVGHGRTNALVLRALLDLSAEESARIKQANDELYAIDVAPGQPPQLWKPIARDRHGAP